MRICMAALMCALLSGGGLAAEPVNDQYRDQHHYQYWRTVDYPQTSQQPLVAVPFDEAVYAATSDQFTDVRLVDDRGVETPFLLQKMTTNKVVTQRQLIQSEIRALNKTGETGIDIILALDKQAANADGLTVQTDLRDFEYSLQIMGSNDGQHWAALVEQAQIYDYSRFMAIRNSDVSLPPNQYRYFRIVVAKAVQSQSEGITMMTRTLNDGKELSRDEQMAWRNQPLHIGSIHFWHNNTETVADAEQKSDHPLAVTDVSQNEKEKTTIIALPANKLPLNGLALNIKSPHFNRHAEVQILHHRGGAEYWQSISRDTLSALQFGDIKHQKTALFFPEQRQPAFRIVIHNQDNPPLEITSVTGVGPAYQLLFLPQPGKQYHLVYGAENMTQPDYEIEPIRELLRHGYQPTPATLGAVVVTEKKGEGLDFIRLLNSKWFLAVVIGIMVLALGWSLFRIAKRVKNMPD